MKEMTENHPATVALTVNNGTNPNEKNASGNQMSAIGVSESVGSRDSVAALPLSKPEQVGTDNVLAPLPDEISVPTGTPIETHGIDNQTVPFESSGAPNEGDDNPAEKEDADNGNTHDNIKKQLASIDEKLSAIAKITSDVSDSITGYFKSVTDRMHQELEGYRSDWERKRELEILEELIAVYDEVQNDIRMTDEDGEKALAMLKALPGFISDLLFNHNVEIHVVNPGEEFSGRWHHAVRPLVATDNSDLDGRIAEVVKDGFDDVKNGIKRLRPAWVRVYKLSQSVSI